MFSAVGTLQRLYYCTVLCLYVLQAVLGGSNHIHIFICQCYGSLTEVQQFKDPSLITLKFCEMLLYQVNLLTVFKFVACCLYRTC
jgi:hypothetical protein